ncbi:alpha/beta fold hydrolase [Nocardia sp. NPDC051750]|uniref:alpha/beta fold hydrolase n=1 Tax=Nocardia sp. NPDC051750 TaxID=3364325 RepID=UPI00378D6E31
MSTPTVVALHSLGLDSGSFDAWAHAVSPRYRWDGEDLAGHGSRAGLRNATLATMARTVSNRISALDGVHLVGHSLGGAVAALAAAAAPPGAVRSLILIATPPQGFPSFAERAEPVAATGSMAPVVEPTLHRWFDPAQLAADTPSIRYCRDRLTTLPPNTWITAWRSFAQFGGYAELGAALPPTLLISGAADQSTSPEQVGAIRPHVPRAVGHEIVADAGHMLIFDHADELAALSCRFWQTMEEQQ